MKYLLSLLTIIALYPTGVFAQGQGAIADTIKGLNDSAGKAGVDVQSTPQEVIGNIINTAVAALAIVAVLFIVYAGFLWVTAGGNDDQVGKAKTMIKNSVIGLIVVSMAYAITAFILSLVIAK